MRATSRPASRSATTVAWTRPALVRGRRSSGWCHDGRLPAFAWRTRWMAMDEGTRVPNDAMLPGVGFFDRNRKQLEERGIDPNRIPPGQYFTERFPVLHVGDVPTYDDLATWSLQIGGLVEQPVTLSWDDLLALPSVELTFDIHCVTKWSKLAAIWPGVRVPDLLGLGRPLPTATHLLSQAE